MGIKKTIDGSFPKHGAVSMVAQLALKQRRSGEFDLHVCY
jgi:hypothetical protein